MHFKLNGANDSMTVANPQAMSGPQMRGPIFCGLGESYVKGKDCMRCPGHVTHASHEVYAFIIFLLLFLVLLYAYIYCLRGKSL